MCRRLRFLCWTRQIICWIRMGWGIRRLGLRSELTNRLLVLNWPADTLYTSMLPRTHPVQIILFSATFPEHVRSFASKFAPNANKIELQQEELSVEGIRQFYMDCRDEEHKYDILVSLYQLLTIGQSIIFCQVSQWPDEY